MTQFTVFSSILSETMRQEIALEMLRVLRPDGFIVWYDYHMNNPVNPDVHGIKKKEITRLFPGCTIYLVRVTLAPPVARVLATVSTLSCHLLSKFPFLCTHYLAAIRP